MTGTVASTQCSLQLQPKKSIIKSSRFCFTICSTCYCLTFSAWLPGMEPRQASVEVSCGMEGTNCISAPGIAKQKQFSQLHLVSVPSPVNPNEATLRRQRTSFLLRQTICLLARTPVLAIRMETRWWEVHCGFSCSTGYSTITYA